jgi:hypothetical protein
MAVAKLLNCGDNTICHHEKSISTHIMKEAYYKQDFTELCKEVTTVILPSVKECNDQKMSYGECSAHLYFVFPELLKVFANQARFVLLVRRPDTFVGSALARGFFDPGHPYPCEHVRPGPDTDIGRQWASLTPFDKCLWYWNMVNEFVYNFLQSLPREMGQIVQIEDINLELIEELYHFFDIKGFKKNLPKIKEILETRINASPGNGNERHLNPRSQKITLGNISTWSTEQYETLVKWAGPMAKKFYPKLFY